MSQRLLNQAKEHLLTLILDCTKHEPDTIGKLCQSYSLLPRAASYYQPGGAGPCILDNAIQGTQAEEIAPQAACAMGATEVSYDSAPEVEKPRRTRKKAETAPPAAEEPPAETEAVELEVVTSAEAKAVTRDDIRAYFVANKSAEIKTKLASLLTTYGAKDLNAVPDDKLAEFHAAFTA